MDTHRLEDLIEFPCDYLFKAFGPNDDVFPGNVRAAVAAVVPVPLDAVRTRASSGDAYICVTIVARLQNASQLEAVYQALRQVPDLRYLL
jgi:putative lipoic acid-binding regulatory protein